MILAIIYGQIRLRLNGAIRVSLSSLKRIRISRL